MTGKRKRLFYVHAGGKWLEKMLITVWFVNILSCSELIRKLLMSEQVLDKFLVQKVLKKAVIMSFDHSQD